MLVIFAVGAVVVHVARYWRPLAFVASVTVSVVLVWAVQNANVAAPDFFGVSFVFEPLARDFVLVAIAMSGVLAIATSFGETRRALGFMFWSWIIWLIALLVNNFVIGVFAWAAGLAVIVLAMEPRRVQRVGGAAYFLVLIVVAGAMLLLGHRFAQLYPLTPDQISLLETSVIFLVWGLGLLLAIVPFFLWLGPMADETPLAIIAVLLGFGQPIGFWLLYALIGQYPRLLELSSLLDFFAYGGMACILLGGILCALERRAARFMSFAGLFALGFILLDFSRGTLEGTTTAVLETFARALGLTLIAASVTVGRNIENRWVNYLALIVFMLGALTLAGLAPGIAFATRWNVLLELEFTDLNQFYFVMLATMGVLLGAARVVRLWLAQIRTPNPASEDFVQSVVVEAPRPFLTRLWDSTRQRFGAAASRLARRFPPPLRHSAKFVAQEWRAFAGASLLIALGLFLLFYSATPNLWLERALETTQQLLFLR